MSSESPNRITLLDESHEESSNYAYSSHQNLVILETNNFAQAQAVAQAKDKPQ